MSKVAVIRCESYDIEEVRKAVKRGIDLLGGCDVFVHSGEKILLKPNLLTNEPPLKSVTTHPAVFTAAAELFINAGADLYYGDSPAIHSTEACAVRSGIAEAAANLNVKPGDFHTGVEVHFSSGIQNKVFTLAKAVADCDGLISISKLKTHGLTRMTGAIKNQFGCIPGKLKSEFHVRIPDTEKFARMLIDLNRLIKPRLYIMDGISAMEGNGPRGGTPHKLNVLLFSKDPVALDSTACRIIDLNPEYVPPIKAGMEMGLGTYDEKQIELIGDDLNSFIDKSFDVNRSPLKPYRYSRVFGYIRNAFVPRPYINADKCKKCGLCVKMCPVTPKAVNWHDGNKNEAPVHNYKKCIRCYCCQEMCPESAITLRVPFARKLIRGK